MSMGYGSQVMGKPKLVGIRKDVAMELGLEEVGSFTGHHCSCHESANEAGSCEATSVSLKCPPAWVQESTNFT